MRFSVIVVAAVALAPLGCGDSTPDPNDPSQANYAGGQGQYQAGGQYPQGQYPPGQYGQPPAGQPGYQQPPPGQPAPGQPAPGQPAPGQPAPAAAGGQATPIAALGPATPILTALAASEVQGMQPDGSAFAGQFQEGQTLEQPINIQPGKCYAVVAAGVGIQEIDVQLVAQPAPMIPPAVLAQDSSTGPTATLGGKGNCFKNPLPIGGPGKVIVRATRGAGIGAAQIYVK
jgi:hypothetical protein